MPPADARPALARQARKEFEGIQFTASDDDTGNRSAGGDWVMESDGIDISADYFDPVQLKLYKDTMGWWNWIPAVTAAEGIYRVAIAPMAKAPAKGWGI